MLLLRRYRKSIARSTIVFGPFTDIFFKPARDVRNAKRHQLQFRYFGKRRVSGLSGEEYNKILKNLDEDTPLGLQRKCYHFIAFELASRGGEASRYLVQHF